MNAEQCDDGWLEPSGSSSLQKGGIHVWRMRVSEVLPHVLAEDLSRDELEPLGGLTNEKVRDQFAVSRWATRQILSNYVSHFAKNLRFEVSEMGKPHLVYPESDLEFSRSHTGDWLVVALTRGASIGVDIEQFKERTQMAAVVKRWFDDSENIRFFEMQESSRREFFYECWTRKEAILKAHGVGLSGLDGDLLRQDGHHFRHFQIGSDVTGCAAKLRGASNGTAPSLKCFLFQPTPTTLTNRNA